MADEMQAHRVNPATEVEEGETATSASPNDVHYPISPPETETFNDSPTNMADSRGQRQERNVHQDYIVRQRYSNALPPPPGAPKLLEIPYEGLSKYTSPAYANRLIREQSLNIEGDAFLGMPIDLVGMPGVFEGDESSIQAPLVPPPVHPRDRALLRPLKSMGKPKTEAGGISFLRRTQYTAEDPGRRAAAAAANAANPAKRRPAKKFSKDDPQNMLREVIKSFDIANPEDAYKGPDTATQIRGAIPTPAELDAWKNPVHPTKPHLKPVDFYPIIPDLEGFTDNGGYTVVKMAGQPTDVTDKHDERMDVGLLRHHGLKDEQIAEWQAKYDAHKADRENVPHPGPPPFLYSFYLPNEEAKVENIKKKFDIHDPDHEDPALYTNISHGGQKDSFRYDLVRDYETGLRSQPKDAYQEVVLALHDPKDEDADDDNDDDEEGPPRRQKAAYFYPIKSKIQLKPRRAKHLAQLGFAANAAGNEDEVVDKVDLSLRNILPEEAKLRGDHKARVDNDEVTRDTDDEEDAKAKEKDNEKADVVPVVDGEMVDEVEVD